jgi:hypothetical protein
MAFVDGELKQLDCTIGTVILEQKDLSSDWSLSLENVT